LLTAVSAVIKPGAELFVGGAAFLATLGYAALRARGNRANRGPAVNTGCGCSPPANGVTQLYRSPDVAEGEQIVCTGDLKDKPAVEEQIDRYRVAFEHLLTTERFPGGFRWRFRAAPGLELQLRRLVEREHDCCRFLQFSLRQEGAELIWETTANEAAASVVEEFALLPQRLAEEPRRGQDVAHLKRTAGAAGLKFAADSRS
jgi:hypothetical protein